MLASAGQPFGLNYMPTMPTAVAAPLADPKVDQLKAMFPDIEADVLEAFLASNQGDVERTCMAILDVPTEEAPAQQDLDASMARALQQEIDAEVARSVAAELTQELNAEEAARRAQEPGARAAAAVDRAVGQAGTQMKALFQRAVRPLSARGRAAGSTHAVRLLDSPADSSAVESDFAPLQLPAFAPPPMQAQPAADAVPDISDAGVAPLTMPAPAGVPSAARYNSRLDRARSANQLRARQASSGVGDGAPSPPAAPAAPYVPEGELI